MYFKIPKIVIIAWIFACIGISTEIVFTSLSKLVNTFIADSAIDWALSGKTYLWMFLIYASIPFLFKLFNPLVEKYHFLLKVLIAVLVVYIVEFSTGFLLEIITGVCPWKYTEGLHIMGYIRLDYAPFWFIFGAMIVWIYQLLDHRIQ